MRRREFFAASLAMSLVPRARAADGRRRVGMLAGRRAADDLAKRLAALGWHEGGNLGFEVRDVPSEPAALAAAATELVALPVDVLLAWTFVAVQALKEATSRIPIVCGGVADPVGYGFARSLRRPGGNITGLSYGKPEVAEIQVALVRRLLPGLRRILLIVPDDRLDVALAERALLATATAVGAVCHVFRPASEEAVDRALATVRNPKREAVYLRLHEGPLLTRALQGALRARIASFGGQDARTVEAGMLMAYWLDYADYTGRIAEALAAMLGGADPAERPFELPDRTHFVVNRRTAELIGLPLPQDVMLRATQVMG